MGVGYQGLQFALLAKRRRVDFRRTMTFGRQNHYLSAELLRSMFSRFGTPLSAANEKDVLANDYAEGLFRVLGADVVDSMDASNYEGATVIHDLNEPIQPSLVRSYSCVVDFGVLEHIFNVPVALKNATDLLKEGGYFLSQTTANNFLGHGFYQFSPELFFNYFSNNGFSDISVYLIPYREFPYFFRVTDPRDLAARVELVNAEPVLIGVMARKTKHLAKANPPIQSDYKERFWRGRDILRKSKVPQADPQIAAAMAGLNDHIRSLMAWPERISPDLTYGFDNRAYYRLMDPAKD